MGRPLKFETAEQMQIAIDAYFCREGKKPTVCELALALGLSTRRALLNYQQRPEFTETVERAKLRIEATYERDLRGAKPTGAIFALKNFGWKDTQTQEHSGPGGKPIMVQVVHFSPNGQQRKSAKSKTQVEADDS